MRESSYLSATRALLSSSKPELDITELGIFYSPLRQFIVEADCLGREERDDPCGGATRCFRRYHSVILRIVMTRYVVGVLAVKRVYGREEGGVRDRGMPVDDAIATRLEHLQLVFEVSGSGMRRDECSWERLASTVFNWKRRSSEVERQREGGMV